jgi:hypothetical protein
VVQGLIDLIEKVVDLYLAKEVRQFHGIDIDQMTVVRQSSCQSKIPALKSRGLG